MRERVIACGVSPENTERRGRRSVQLKCPKTLPPYPLILNFLYLAPIHLVDALGYRDEGDGCAGAD